MNYFRRQDPGHTLEEMQDFRSFHGYVWNEEIEEEVEHFLDGLACSEDCWETNWGGAGLFGEIVVLRGIFVEDIYDGVVIYPTEIIARYTAEQWGQMWESGEVEIYQN